MKKIILFAAVISAFAFASCKKDRTCTCTATSTYTQTVATDWETRPSTSSTTSDGGSGAMVTIINDAKKKDAKKACIDESTESTDVDVVNDSVYDFSMGDYESYTRTTTNTNKTDAKCSLK